MNHPYRPLRLLVFWSTITLFTLVTAAAAIRLFFHQ